MIWQIGSVIYDVAKPLIKLADTVSSAVSFFSGGSGDSSIGTFGTVMEVAVLGGYVLFLLGIIKFVKILDGNDAQAMGRVRTGIFLGIAAAICTMIGIPIMPTILNIIGFILMLIGYSALRKSATFPDNARKGAGKLRGAMIWLIIGFVLGLLPLAGGFFRMICSIVSFFMVLSGWACIKNAMPNTANASEQPLTAKGKLLYLVPLIALFALDVWGKIQMLEFIGNYFSNAPVMFFISEVLLSAALITTLVFAFRANPKTKWFALGYVIFWSGVIVSNLIIQRHLATEQGVELQPYQFIFYVVLLIETALLAVALRDIFFKKKNQEV
jgi:hypothetical protein